LLSIWTIPRAGSWPCPAPSGLGLAIVKGDAEAMGFTVEAARRQGGGSRFTIRMPVDAIVQVSLEDIA
jgi:two-component system, OmpR family, sensor histidine kinase KdpD